MTAYERGRCVAPVIRSNPFYLGAGLIVLAAWGCLGGPAQPPGPMVSPTGIVYPLGTRPRETRYSQTAQLYFAREQWERGLRYAEEGMRDDPENPLHYFQAASALIRLGRYAGADTLFERAQRLYPAYELQTEPARENAWVVAYNTGVEASAAGDEAAARAAWKDAATIFDLRPEAHINLGRLLAAEERNAEAIAIYERALAGLGRLPATRVLDADALRRRTEDRTNIEEALEDLLVLEERYAEAEPLARARLSRDPTSVPARLGLARIMDARTDSAGAGELYASLLTDSTIETGDLLDLGVSLFHTSRYLEAAEAFRRLTKRQAQSRDAWFNYANALFAGQAWEELTHVGSRLLEVDPLDETASLMTATARLESGDRPGALAAIQRLNGLPIHVARLRLRRTGRGVTLLGDLRGNGAEPGTPIRLRFEFFDGTGSLGTQEVEVLAPERGSSSELSLTFAAPAVWYRYEVFTEPRPDAERGRLVRVRPDREEVPAYDLGSSGWPHGLAGQEHLCPPDDVVVARRTRLLVRS